LRQLQNLNGLAVTAAYLQRANDPFINRYARLAWQFDQNRTAFNIDVARYEERHLEDFGLNQNRTQADATLRRNLAPALTLSLGATYARSDYLASADNYHEVLATAALDWRFGRHLDVRAEYDRFDQRAEVTTNEYRENRIGLTVGWQVDSLRSPGVLERNGTSFPGL
jgi:uncharacterized protein (PEP-CTERM system associated)